MLISRNNQWQIWDQFYEQVITVVQFKKLLVLHDKKNVIVYCKKKPIRHVKTYERMYMICVYIVFYLYGWCNFLNIINVNTNFMFGVELVEKGTYELISNCIINSSYYKLEE